MLLQCPFWVHKSSSGKSTGVGGSQIFICMSSKFPGDAAWEPYLENCWTTQIFLQQFPTKLQILMVGDSHSGGKYMVSFTEFWRVSSAAFGWIKGEWKVDLANSPFNLSDYNNCNNKLSPLGTVEIWFSLDKFVQTTLESVIGGFEKWYWFPDNTELFFYIWKSIFTVVSCCSVFVIATQRLSPCVQYHRCWEMQVCLVDSSYFCWPSGYLLLT